MKYYSLLLLAISSVVFGDMVLDENTPGLSLGSNARLAYVSGAEPDNGVTPNAILFGRNSTVSAVFNVEQGSRYRIKARRKINSSVNISFNLSINGSVIYTDWCMVPQGMTSGFEEMAYPGYIDASSSQITVVVTGAGSSDSCIDYMILEKSSNFFFDENLANVEYSGIYGLTNIPYTMPKTGDNAISFTDSGTAVAQVALEPGVYAIYANRTVNSNGQLAYSIAVNGDTFRDNALTVKYFNDFVEEEFVGSVSLREPLSTVKIYDGGASYARLDYLRFEKIADRLEDVYFDQDSPGTRFVGDVSSVIAEGTIDIFQIVPGASVEGRVRLVPGKAYNVYVNRSVDDTGSMGYDINLGSGKLVASDDAIAVSSGSTFEEKLIGSFVADTLLTDIRLDNAGSSNAGIDYVRFEELPYQIFDESVPDLALTGNAALAYDPAAIPDDGQSSNAIFFSGSDTVDGTLEVIPSQKYKVICRRKVHPTGQISFSIDIDDTVSLTDVAIDGTLTDVYAQIEYPGYYLADDSVANVKLFNGGPWVARFDYLYLKPDISEYFDENVSDISFTGSAGYATVSGSLPPHADNALWLTGINDVAKGTVRLSAGQLYNVYSRRVVSIYDLSDYDIFINGSFFCHDFTQTTDVGLDGNTEEVFLKQYKADSDSVVVSLQYCGDYGAVIDYLRFEPVFDQYCGQTETTLLEGDLNGDCAVDLADYMLLLARWLSCYDPADETCLN